jgi:23S rRNA pseudouridine1911/1915/1917 synthase
VSALASDVPRTLEVGAADSGQRLDVFLADRLRLSRAETRRLLARGAVSVSGRSVASADKGLPVQAGERIEVAPFTRPGARRAREQPELDLVVRARGPGWLALEKPAGVPVHPLEEAEGGTLLNALVARHPEIHGVGEGGLRSGVVHRLDVETSGVVLFATREDAWQRLREAFRAHRVEKRYRAIVRGRLEGGDRLELPLVTARHRPARVRVASPREAARGRGVRQALLRWRAIELLDAATLVEVRPVTGFLHQIRVSLAELGHPVVGDRAYGVGRDPTGAARHMLHASRVACEEIEGSSPDPPDFAALLERLRG